MKKNISIKVQWINLNVVRVKKVDYISLTDMIKAKDWDFFISDRLRNRNTVEFLSIREEINNPNFNYGECAIIKSKVWLNNYKISVKDWVERTNAIWLVAKTWRYWWTYAHKDIAFEFGMWISPKFKIYLIKEFQILKEKETQSLDRDVKRFLTKMNYKIHTDAIKENLIPNELTSEEINCIYANEADVLNKALFWMTAKDWKNKNLDKIWQGELPGKGKRGWPGSNMRDYSTIEQLIILANIESMNAKFIEMWLKQSDRLWLLNETAITQMKSLLGVKSRNNYLWWK